jgi:NADH-quinone oxidoreductase subunit J
VSDAIFWLMALAAVLAGWRVFRADSMVHAAYWLMGSFVAVAVILVLLGARFLGLVLVLMMAGEMSIMAVFMVMFMMNPAGLNPMTMVHQHRTAIAAGVVAFLGLAAVGLFAHFPTRPPPDPAGVTAALGTELLGGSMLVFETAGVALLATMIGALALASTRGRFGDAEAGSEEPPTVPGAPAAPEPVPVDEHEGHAMSHDDMAHDMDGGA